VGAFQPRVILPDSWKEWSPEKLEVILTHERAHVRWRDPLIQWLALFNRALF
jgi:beta-lactamase regulating signal transducer with metallopeptidase domain